MARAAHGRFLHQLPGGCAVRGSILSSTEGFPMKRSLNLLVLAMIAVLVAAPVAMAAAKPADKPATTDTTKVVKKHHKKVHKVAKAKEATPTEPVKK